MKFHESNVESFCSRICSVPPRSPPHVIKSDEEDSESENEKDQVVDESESEENEEEECGEESEENNVISNEQSGFLNFISTVLI